MNLNRQDSVNAINISEKYDRYCRELDKEDKLLNDRVTWLLVSQSILFAAVRLGGQDPGGNIVEIIAKGRLRFIGNYLVICTRCNF